MRSIKEIFVVGHGPSSSHTMGPAFACQYILNKYHNITNVDVTLYGSLALTGKGHLTDYIVDKTLKDVPHKINFDYITEINHPNTIKFVVTSDGIIYEEDVISIGGGSIKTSDSEVKKIKDTYKEKNLTEMLSYCRNNNLTLVDYINKFEDKDINEYLENIYKVMKESVNNGINATGVLPGNLKVKRKAHDMLEKLKNIENKQQYANMSALVASFAVAEENAAGGIISIAPTCGSAGVIPGVLTYLEAIGIGKKQIIDGLKIAGLIGIIAKTNASVSGAEAGCQAEIGVACSMGAGMIASALNLGNDSIARATEIALEHSLGLTCDPVQGYVQIPCIERCAIYALKAINAVQLVELIGNENNKVSFDDSLETMYQTGKDLQAGYRETSQKGLSTFVKSCE